MKYCHFLTKLTITDALLDELGKEEKDNNVEVSCNKVKGVPVLFFKHNNKVMDCIVLGESVIDE